MRLLSQSKITALCAITLTATFAAGCITGPEDENNAVENGSQNVNNNPDPSTCADIGIDDITSGVTLDGNCYNLTGSPNISAGQLTIAAGTTIYFGQNEGLQITNDGSLVAEGTSDAPIRLLGRQEETGYWRGLRFDNSPSSDNSLDHVILEHAGSERWRSSAERSQGGLVTEGTQTRLSVANSTFRYNSGAGIATQDRPTSLSIESSHFESNEAPLFLHVGTVDALSSDLTFTDNDENFALIGDGRFQHDLTWPALDIPYQLKTTIQSNSENILTIEAGVSLIFPSNSGIRLENGSSIIIDGTDENKVHMRGLDPDPGFWKGIFLRSSTNNQIDHLILEHAGSERWLSGTPLSQGGLSTANSDVNLEVTNSIFRNNAFAGISISDNGNRATISSSTFENNEYPIQLRTNHLSDIASDNEFIDNTNNVVLVVGNSDLNRDVVWNALTIPYRFTSTPRISGALVISPGAHFEFENHAGLTVGPPNNGTLDARGTDNDPIIFSGMEDLQGFWRGIHYRSTTSANNQLQYIEIHHAGSERWLSGSPATHAALAVNDSQVEANNLVITDSGGFGIGLQSSSVLVGCDQISFSNIGEAEDVLNNGSDSCFE